MLFRVAARIAGDDDVIAPFQCVAGYILSAQFPSAASLNFPSLHDALCIRGIDLNERMRIAELELDDRSFNLDCLVFVVCCGERMMRVELNAGDEHCDREQS